MPDKETMERLYQKFLKNEITMEELEQFLSETDAEYGEQLVAKMIDGTWKEMYPEAKVVRMARRRWISIAAAVIVFVLLAAGGYWIMKPSVQTDVVRSTNDNNIKQDIHPGGNKATLTLADGSTIILDSANNGNITRQGNVTVIKLDDGQLSYHPSDNANAEVVYNTIATPRGGQYQVVLADGSKVWLNAASSITFPTSFPGKEREVKVTGEAYFEVAHNAAKPFRVSVGDMKVEVLGTHFNVNAYEDEEEIKTTLLEGSVVVKTSRQSIKIKPGQQTEVENGFIKLNNDVNMDVVMAWKNGVFLFDRADIHKVMDQIKRWYDVDVEYKGKVTKHFGGTISRDVNASELFKLLEMTGGVNFKIDGRKVLVMP